MQAVESRVIKILSRIRDHYPDGIRESRLPNEDHLVMFRLTNRKFLKAMDSLETGEGIFAITEDGLKEASRELSN